MSLPDPVTSCAHSSKMFKETANITINSCPHNHIIISFVFWSTQRFHLIKSKVRFYSFIFATLKQKIWELQHVKSFWHTVTDTRVWTYMKQHRQLRETGRKSCEHVLLAHSFELDWWKQHEGKRNMKTTENGAIKYIHTALCGLTYTTKCNRKTKYDSLGNTSYIEWINYYVPFVTITYTNDKLR